jgi:hypothetical protein
MTEHNFAKIDPDEQGRVLAKVYQILIEAARRKAANEKPVSETPLPSAAGDASTVEPETAEE